ncbi:hypothetical protein PDE_04500 [Penicillium oxalicum 114-2]|uniref:TMEM205-like domain-containing protein n=1 Tax=Penicillium oxalicum (strain 114-2 / CGMCC 5302) TaxID=933388 RepID=S7ZFU4_PENO1|nr:hypothetical protein PDE_04500 [Penicillium oxalicum 114-2]
MERLLSTAGSVLPYHILSYGALLGTELYQSFVNTKICFQELPMREFLVLQRRLFPVYFKWQVGLAALTAATHPPCSIASIIHDSWAVIPLVVVIGTSSLNWLVYGPRTTQSAFVRRTLERGKDQAGVDDQRVRQAQREFTFNHAMSIHLNAVAIVATVLYGISLSSRLQMS